MFITRFDSFFKCTKVRIFSSLTLLVRNFTESVGHEILNMAENCERRAKRQNFLQTFQHEEKSS